MICPAARWWSSHALADEESLSIARSTTEVSTTQILSVVTSSLFAFHLGDDSPCEKRIDIKDWQWLAGAVPRRGEDSRPNKRLKPP